MDAFYSHYPFLEGAKAVVKEITPHYTQDEILDKAQDRLESAVGKGEVPTVGTTSRGIELDLLSYAAARMVLVAAKNKAMCARVAAAEGRRASRYLQQESDEKLLSIAKELELGLSKESSGFFALPFFDYLRFKPKEEEFKLSAKPIAGGVVTLSRKEAERFVQEAARMKMDVLVHVSDMKFSPQILEIGKKAIALLPKASAPIENIAKTEFPPCICRIIEDMKNGEHIGHQARWALGVYLVRSGMKIEDVLAIYADSPEYNEGTTKYQLEYIKGKEYSMPSCATMDTYGLAQNNCPCLVAGVRRGTPVTNSRRRAATTYEKTKVVESKTTEKPSTGDKK